MRGPARRSPVATTAEGHRVTVVVPGERIQSRLEQAFAATPPPERFADVSLARFGSHGQRYRATGRSGAGRALPAIWRQVRAADRLHQLDHQITEELKAAGFRYVVASSLRYDLYYYGATLRHQKESVYEAKRTYDDLFDRFPYHEVNPEYKSFAYSNPVIRILDLDK